MPLCLLISFLLIPLSFILAYFLIEKNSIQQNFTQNVDNIPMIDFETTPSGKISDVAIVMVNVNDPRGKYSVPLWKQYCKIHGYDFIQLKKDSVFDKNKLHPAWWKIPLCASVFSSNKYKYIVHVDADTAPIRLNLSVASFLHDHKGNGNVSIWFSKEPPVIEKRHEYGSLNTGVFVLRNDEFSWNFLNEVWKRHKTNGTKWPWEQGAIEDYVANLISSNKKLFDEKIMIVEYGLMQSFYLKEDGCDLLKLNECSIVTSNPWIAHIIKTVHPNWELIYQKLCTDRNIIIE